MRDGKVENVRGNKRKESTGSKGKIKREEGEVKKVRGNERRDSMESYRR